MQAAGFRQAVWLREAVRAPVCPSAAQQQEYNPLPCVICFPTASLPTHTVPKPQRKAAVAAGCADVDFIHFNIEIE